MQHKPLFAALMIGSLALASCVKSIESPSVTEVRNARADELKSQTELNRANAQAATTLANAQASLAASEAKLNEAMGVSVGETAYAPQEGLGALSADSFGLGFLAAPRIKVGFLF